MKKLRLDLDALMVESFDTAGAVHRAGTVRGHDDSDTGALNCGGGSIGCPNDTLEPCDGGASAATACGPCPTHDRTACNHETCMQTYCGSTCGAVSGPCHYTCDMNATCLQYPTCIC